MRPILFHILGLPVRAYGAMVMLGFVLAMWRTVGICTRRMLTEPKNSPRRIHPDIIYDAAMYGLFFTILGARVVFVLLSWDSYAREPSKIFMLWEGGLSFHGAMIFGLAFLFIYCRLKKLSFLAFGDLVAPGWALVYAIGRIGCLLNGCCYGAPSSVPWALRFPDEKYLNNPGPVRLTDPSHPTQLYAFLFNIFFFFVLTRWEKRPHRDGELFFGYVAMYGAYRIFVEMFRMGVTSTYLIPSLHLTDVHIVSGLMILGGVAGLLTVRRKGAAAQPVAHPTPASSAGT
jgi:phosphatidylglycerol:prolipoprotein diacylglycerol transferase